MDWTVNDYAHANHPPVAAIRDELRQSVIAGRSITLDASPSSDPDGDRLSYRWFHYAEAGSGNFADIAIQSANSPRVIVTATSPCRPMWIDGYVPCKGSGTAHVILAVTDDGKPALTRYARIILTVEPNS
jgi:hypothetical protein